MLEWRNISAEMPKVIETKWESDTMNGDLLGAILRGNEPKKKT